MANQKIRIRLKSHDSNTVLHVSANKIVESAQRTGAQMVGPIPLPTERSVYTVIRSPHKYKDSHASNFKDAHTQTFNRYR